MVIGFVDWGVEEHQVAFIDDSGQLLKQIRVTHNAEGMGALMAAVREVAPDQNVRMGIERCDGAVVDTLLEHDVEVYSINPKQLDRYRQFLVNSGAKDDVLDAHAGARALREAPDAFRRLEPLNPVIAELREMVRHRAELKKEIGRVSNRLREQLRRVYPQFLEMISDSSVSAVWVRQMLELAPTSVEAQALKVTEVARVCKRLRTRTPKQILTILQATSFEVPSGVLQGAHMRIESYVAELNLLCEQLKRCEDRQEKLVELWGAQQESLEGLTDLEIMRSMPSGTVTMLAPRIAFGFDAIGQRDAKLLSKQSGSVPVSALTGKQQNRKYPRKKQTVRRRLACNEYLRNAAFHIGDSCFHHDPFYKAKYAAGRAKGHTHGRTCRDIAEHYDRVMMSCLKTRTLYDVNRLMTTS
jgi:predicted nuclease with TOPRIM domain